MAFRPFPVELFPEPIRGFLIQAAKSMQCDASMIGLPLLSAIASAIGNTHRLRMQNGWDAPPIIWTAVVGESGSMKSPAFRLATKAINKRQADAFKEHADLVVDAAADQMRYEAALAEWKRKAASGKDDGDPPEKPITPTARRYIVSDTTVEALAPILRANPRGLLLARNEMAGWLASFDRYSKGGSAGGDSAHWLEMFDGDTMTVDRKTGIPPTIHVPSASVCIAGGIQPGILARSMGKQHHESGMVARILFAMPPRQRRRWNRDNQLNPDLERKLANVFDLLFTLTPEVDEFGDEQPRVLTLTAKANEVWGQFYNEHDDEQAALSGDLLAAWSKLEGYAARLALVFHWMRWACADGTIEDLSQVDEISVAAGIRLARWFGNETERVYAVLAETETGRDVRRLVEWIRGRGGEVTASEIAHGMRKYRNKPDEAAADLNELVQDGVGRWVSTNNPKGGPVTDRFRLSSTVTVTETSVKPENCEGCSDSDAGDDSGGGGQVPDDMGDDPFASGDTGTRHRPDDDTGLQLDCGVSFD